MVTIGQVQLLARDKVRSGHVEVDELTCAAADTRAQGERPQGFGVRVIQGAFTLWNMQADDQVSITAKLLGLSAGSAAAPVLGSGIFVSGPGFDGGRLSVHRLETGPVYSDGRIAAGTPDVITGGVFTVHGAYVDIVRNLGAGRNLWRQRHGAGQLGDGGSLGSGRQDHFLRSQRHRLRQFRHRQ